MHESVRKCINAMAYVPFTNVAKTSMDFLWASQNVAMTFHSKKATAWTVADLQDLNDIFETWMENDLKTLMSTAISLIKVVSTDLTTSSSPSVELVLGTPIAGVVGGASVPNNTTLTASTKTTSRGRSYRGRNYIPGIPASVQTSSTAVTTAYATNVAFEWNSLFASLAVAGFQAVVASRYSNNTERIIGVATAISEVLVETFLDSQRRRLAKRGQ